MKSGLVLLLLLIAAITGNARQLYSVANGAWQDAGTWNNQQIPATRHDTITIYHALSINADLLLDSCFVHIKPTGGFCGDFKLTVGRGSYVLNDSGYIGVYEMHIMDTVINYGCLDVGEEGIMLSGGILRVEQNVGKTIVHYGRQVCPFPCPATIDTFLQADTLGNTVTFNVHYQPGIYISYIFGDDERDFSNNSVTHTYTGYGQFTAMVIMFNCCTSDTLYRTFYFEPPPPPCREPDAFNIYPNPATNVVWLEKDFCNDEIVSLRMFSITGQLVAEGSFETVDKYMKAAVDVYFLSNAFYIVEAVSSRAVSRKKILVLND